MAGAGGGGEEGRASLTIDGTPPRGELRSRRASLARPIFISGPAMKGRFVSVDAPAGAEPTAVLSQSLEILCNIVLSRINCSRLTGRL